MNCVEIVKTHKTVSKLKSILDIFSKRLLFLRFLSARWHQCLHENWEWWIVWWMWMMVSSFRDIWVMGMVYRSLLTYQISRLADNKAVGTDALGSSFIKQLVGVIELPLVLIFQQSLRTGQVPMQWKEANVTVIFKTNGQWCEPGNYRPVSLMSQISRIFEKIIRDHLVQFLEDNELLKNSQHGFRSKKSFLTNLLEFMDLVSNNTRCVGKFTLQ